LIGRVAAMNAARAYLVGGPLRDILLGKRIVDLDVAVSANCQAVGRKLGALLKGDFIFYRDFNTGTITLRHGQSIDLAQTRTERYPEPAALPVVSNADIISDLRRRDFTVNAMALDLNHRRFGSHRFGDRRFGDRRFGELRFGELIDPYGGFNDLLARVVRVLHSESFIDDPTRIFRAERFAVRFGFRLEPETQRLMRAAIQKKVIRRLSGERILHEIELILRESQPVTILRHLQSVLVQLGFRLPDDFFTNLKRLAGEHDRPKLMVIYLFSCLNDAAKYPLKKETVQAIRDLRSFPRIEKVLTRAKKPSVIYALLKRLSPDALTILKLVKKAAVGRKIRSYEQRYARTTIGVRGDDLKRLGIPPGEVYKKIFDELLNARLDGKIRNRAQEKCYLQKLVVELC